MSTKQRYIAGRFNAHRFAAGRYRGGGTNQPDFMHGVLNIFPTLSGDVRIKVTLIGEVNSFPSLGGKIEINK